jgi:phosphatidylglycerol lysyltransferase
MASTLKSHALHAWEVLHRPTVTRWLKIGFAVGVFVIALLVIRRQLHETSIAEIIGALRTTPASQLWMSAGAVLLSYLCLGVTEVWVLKSLGHHIGKLRAVLTSFVAYSLANSVGFGPAAVSAVRIRFYGSEGLKTKHVAAITVLAAVVVTLTGVVIAGLGLLLSPTAPVWLKLVGVLLLAPAACLFIRRERKVMKVEIEPPRLPGRMTMLATGMGDWIFSGGALFVLLPNATPEALPGFLAVFVLGSVISSASGIPAGIGIFEAVVLGLRAASGGVQETAAALILYRLVNALGPLAIAGAGVAIHQLMPKKRDLRGRAVRST